MGTGLQGGSEFGKFVFCYGDRSDLAFDVALGFLGQIVEVVGVDIAHQHKVDDARVLALGVVVDEIGPLQVAQAGDDALDHLVDAHHLAHHGHQLGKEGVVRVGRVEHLAPVAAATQQLRTRELVELFAHRVGGNLEFAGQFAQVGLGQRVQEQPDQQFDTGLGPDEA